MSALILAISLAAQGQEEPKPTVEELIKNLGSEEFKVREEAQKKLELMGNEIVPQLKEAQEKTEDPEIKTRLADVMARIDANRKAQDRIAQVKKILEKMSRLLEDEEKGADERLRELAKLASELELATGHKKKTEDQGMDGVIRIRGGALKVIRKIEPAPEEPKKEAPPEEPKK